MAECGSDGTLELTIFRRDELVDVRVRLAPPPEDTVWVEFLQRATPAERAAFEAWSGQAFPVEGR